MARKYKYNCYAATEALYHLLGGKESGWRPKQMWYRGQSHWFLARHGHVLDPTRRQFGAAKPRYRDARGRGFLTKEPSKRAAELMEKILFGT